MAIHGKATSVVIEALDVSNWLNSIDISESLEAVETSGFQQEEKTYIPGIAEATASFGGRFQGQQGTVDAIIKEHIADELEPLATIGWGMGLKQGNPALFGRVTHTTLATSAPISDVVGIDGDLQYNGKLYDGRYVLGKTVLTATGNGPTLDNVVTLDGQIGAMLHVLDNDNSGAVTIKIQHSVNGSVWTDLVTFAALSAGEIGAELKTLQGNVNRYLRATATLAGSGNVLALVALGVN